MADIKPDIQQDITSVEDGDEHISLMEPMLISRESRFRPPLDDLVLELAQSSAKFHGSLPAALVGPLDDLVRSMNCYYSNLIEGHDTHPIDIERALKNDYSTDIHKRDLQIEARAHITVQRWIDEGGLAGRSTTSEGICEIHKRFCKELPEDLLWVENPDTHERIRVIPGEMRKRGVRVGGHIAISPGAVPRFLKRFEDVYGTVGKTERIMGSAAAHHRLLWIHAFMDGNGRVARLMSHAMLLELLDTGGLLSIARGLARNVDIYKGHLAACDRTRRNDLDGRGNLSEEALDAFTEFFLKICIDQVKFMEDLMQPEELKTRILRWTGEEMQLRRLLARSDRILEAILYRGELSRSEVEQLLGVTERHARRVVAALVERGVLTAENSRAPLRLVFPAALAGRWVPGLFPEKIS